MTTPVAEPKQQSNLVHNAMLVRLEIGAWRPVMAMPSVAHRIAQQEGAHPEWVTSSKKLLESEEMTKLNSLAGKARSWHMQYTMPWEDGGPRLLPVSLYPVYKKRITQLIDDRLDALNDFLLVYPQQKVAAQQKLGSLYDPGDYPSEDELRNRIVMNYYPTPVPSASHFIADLATDEAEQIRRSVEADIEAKLNTAIGTLYQKLATAVQSMMAAMTPDENGAMPPAWSTPLDTLHDLVDYIPAMNITGDRMLARLCAEVRSAVDGVDSMYQIKPPAQSVKPALYDDDARLQMESTMESVADKLAGFGFIPGGK